MNVIFNDMENKNVQPQKDFFYFKEMWPKDCYIYFSSKETES